MSQAALDDWTASLLSTRRNREIAKFVHIGQDRVRAVRTSQADHTRILHQMGRPTEVTAQIKRAVTELTLQHPNFADLQIVQIISERFAIPIARMIINRLRHLAHFKLLPQERCQKLTEIQTRQGYQFASDFISGKLPTENLIFSDESRFCMGPDNRWVWRRGENMRKGFSPRLRNTRESRFIYGRRLGLVLHLVFSIFEETANSDVYVEALESSEFLRMADERFGERQWHFVQDGVSCHTSASTLDDVFVTFFCNGRPIRLISTRWNVSGEQSKEVLIRAKFQRERKQIK
jgi:hypothetical protein